MTPAVRDDEAAAAPPPSAPAPTAEEPLTAFRVIRLDPSGVSVIEPAVPSTPAGAAVEPDPTAPRRAVPLAPPTAKELAAARDIALAAARPRLAARAAKAKASRPAIETKLAGAADSDEMLRVLGVEVALQRARRLSGATDKQREFLRVLSILMLFGLAVVVVGAMWYLQTLRQGRANLGHAPRPAASHVQAAPPRTR